MKGSKLTDSEKADVAKKLSRFTGLSEDYLVKADLRVRFPQFRAELQRSHGLITGRYDAAICSTIFSPSAPTAILKATRSPAHSPPHSIATSVKI